MSAPAADDVTPASAPARAVRPRPIWIVAGVVLVAAIGVGIWRWNRRPPVERPALVASTCAANDVPGLVACVDGARYAADLAFVAKPRPAGSDHLADVEDLCADRLTQLGYTVERQSFDARGGSGVNVIGRKAGEGKQEEHVIVGAHYDHIPKCSGADDNASGVAGALEVARVLAGQKFARSLVVACWDKEETGRLGSIEYAERAVTSGQRIAVYFNFEMIGFASSAPRSQTIPIDYKMVLRDQVKRLAANDYRADFVLAVADESAKPHLAALRRFADTGGLPMLEVELPHTEKNKLSIAHLRRSDHASFWERDFPAVLLTDTAEFRNPRYHCARGDDSADVLDTTFAARVVASAVGAAAEALEPIR